MFFDEVVAGEEQPDIRFFADVAFDANDANISVLVEESLDGGKGARIVPFVFAKVSRRIIAGHQNAESILATLAGKLHRNVRVDDRASVYRAQGRVEDVDALQKEWSLLFKEDGKALIRG